MHLYVYARVFICMYYNVVVAYHVCPCVWVVRCLVMLEVCARLRMCAFVVQAFSVFVYLILHKLSVLVEIYDVKIFHYKTEDVNVSNFDNTFGHVIKTSDVAH